MLWTLLTIWGATVTFYLLFLVFATYQNAREAGREVPLFSKLVMAPALVFGALLDVAWNLTLGTLLFAEWPKLESGFTSWTFTARLQRLKHDPGWRGSIAQWFAKQLNWADPGHV